MFLAHHSALGWPFEYEVELSSGQGSVAIMGSPAQQPDEPSLLLLDEIAILLAQVRLVALSGDAR